MYQILALIIGDRRALNNAIGVMVPLNKLPAGNLRQS